MKKFFTVGITVAMLCATFAARDVYAACEPSQEFTTMKKGVLTIAALAYRPFSTVEPDGSVGGVDGEILKEFAKMECLNIETIVVDSAAALNYVQTGKADVTVGDWYRTAARHQVMEMSDPLYLDQMGIVSKDGTSKLSDLEGRTVGTVQSNLWVADLKKIYGSKLKLYPVLENVKQDLRNGRIDALVEGYSMIVITDKQGDLKGYKYAVAVPDDRVAASKSPGQGSFPLNKDNPSLLKAINSDIAKMHANGFIKQILVKFGLDPSAAETGAPRWLE